MIIHRICLRNYRGTKTREIEFGPGVTIIEGPNEIGKSSLAEAVRLIFEHPDTSKKRGVQAIAPVHDDTGPEVEIELETGPYRMIYRKRFIKQPETHLRLTEPKPENLTGRQAHERVVQILDETVDMNLWHALQIEQGSAIGQARLADSGALSKALDEATGGSGADEDGHLFDRTREEYERYYTATGKEKGILTDASEAVSQCREQVQDLKERFRAIEGDVDRSAQLVTRRDQLVAEVASAEADRKCLDEQWKHVLALEAQVKEAVAASENRGLKHEAADRAVLERGQWVKEAEKARKDLEELREKTGGEKDLLKEARRELEAASPITDDLKRELKDAEETAIVRMRDEEFRRDELDCVQMTERHDRVVALKKGKLKAEEIVARITVTEEVLADLLEARTDLLQAQARLEEGGPTIEIQALRDIEIEIDGDSRTLACDGVESRPVTDELSVLVPGDLTMKVSPGHSTADLQASATEAARRQKSLYQKHGVESVKAAVEANAQLQQAHRNLQDADRLIAENVRDLTSEDLETRLRSLVQKVQAYDDERQSDLKLADNFDEAKSFHATALEERKAVAQRLAQAQGNQKELERRVREIESTGLKAEGQEETLAAQTETLDRRLAASREKATDESLSEDSQRMGEHARYAAEELEKAQAQLTKLDPDTVGSLRDNVQQVLADLKREQQQVGEDLAGAQARIEALCEVGVHEQLELKCADLEHAERHQQTTADRAAAARLLFEVLERYRKAAKRSYVLPLSEQIESLGRIVFGRTFKIALNDDLEMESRTIEDRTVPFGSLSKGAQEQLGVLARLAVAILVAKVGGVPLIMDDTLGNTDPARLKSMGAMLARAGKECQIIVLTCMPDRFRSVGGARLEMIGARDGKPLEND